jgi:hypothetical protein
MRRFYRITNDNPPMRSDFESNRQQRRRARTSDPEILRLLTGISVFEELEQARQQMRRFPYLGKYIVELTIPPDAEVRWERTTARPGHYTLWGEPENILRFITNVHIDSDEPGVGP